MTKDRFDLEQSIMECWNVTSDLDLLFGNVLDRPTPLTVDETANILLGMKELYNLKFEKLWNIFETVTREKTFYGHTEFNSNYPNPKYDLGEDPGRDDYSEKV